jgi:transcription antitermination factor NusG
VRRQGFRKGRKLTREIARPMFPGYVFIQFGIDNEKFAEVRVVPGITGYLRDEAGEPQAVPDVAMDIIAASETEEFGRYVNGGVKSGHAPE